MLKSETNTNPSLLSWSHTGKRGREPNKPSTQNTHTTQDHEIAHFLLMLSSHPSTTVNDDRRKFRCEICYKMFASGQALGGHKRSHMEMKVGGNPFKCSICCKIFASWQALGGHMRWHWEKKDGESVADSLNQLKRKRKKKTKLRSLNFDLNLPPLKDESDYLYLEEKSSPSTPISPLLQSDAVVCS